MKFTKPTLAKLSCPDGKAELIAFDDDLPGFGVRMHPSGRGTWFVQFRIGAKQRRMKIGKLDTIDVEEARRQARQVLAKAHLGVDAQAEKSQAKAKVASTLGSIIPLYLAYASKRQKPSHHEGTKRYLEKHWAPLASLPVEGLQRGRVALRLAEIAKESGPFASNRARAALSSLFTWAIGEGLAHANPVIGTNRPAEEVARDRVLSDDELGAVWKHAGEGDYGAIIRLLILTGARRDEIGGLGWSEIRGGMIHLNGQRTKNGKPHEVPLSAPAQSIVNGIPVRAERDLVFGSGQGAFSGWSRAKSDLDARLLAALKDQNGEKAKLIPWRLHDLRRTAATRMADLGVFPHIVEAVLNHISGHKGGIGGVYNRAKYLPERSAALALWGEHVGSLSCA